MYTKIITDDLTEKQNEGIFICVDDGHCPDMQQQQQQLCIPNMVEYRK